MQKKFIQTLSVTALSVMVGIGASQISFAHKNSECEAICENEKQSCLDTHNFENPTLSNHKNEDIHHHCHKKAKECAQRCKN